eukprot:maker-scaffold661_size154698-snap-gene-0.21 protein:Tk09488 transcript:maker-scaffold661_size154698-snap-gene-0.21-mRNA-1 annotation:"tyramine beta-hydroxylase-like"
MPMALMASKHLEKFEFCPSNRFSVAPRCVHHSQREILDTQLNVILLENEFGRASGLGFGGGSEGDVGSEQVVDGRGFAHAGLAEDNECGVVSTSVDPMGVVGVGEDLSPPDFVPGPHFFPQEGHGTLVLRIDLPPLFVEAHVSVKLGEAMFPGHHVTLVLVVLMPIASYQYEFLSKSGTPIYSEILSPQLNLHWQVDLELRSIVFEVEYAFIDHGAASDWVGVGFSDYGDLGKGDLCLMSMDWKGDFALKDVHSNNFSRVDVDQSQDCRDFKYKIFADGTVFTFARDFDTCDVDDYVIEDGTTHIIWAHGLGPMQNLRDITLDSAKSGMVRTRLLKVPDVPELPIDDQTIDFTHEILIPSDDTTYWCSVHRLPDELIEKHHVIQYEPIKTKGNEHILHHMEVFHCDAPPDEEFPLWNGPCGDNNAPKQLQKCKKVLAAWAIGAGPFTYPEEAGLALGGPDFNPYVMLEIHYNNQNMESGHQDQSGMRLHITPELRQFDAGIMELGLTYTDKMAIPPQVTEFPLRGYCLPECTEQGIPDFGITVFGSQLHTHGTGIRVATLHARNGVQLPDLNRDNHYSTHFQEIRALHNPVKVLPGDTLINQCWHSTLNKKVATLGGYGFQDEMCLNYIHYYPKIELEVCKSSVDTDALDDYFRYLNEKDDQLTSSFKNVSENYYSIDWTPQRALDLEKFYANAPVEMQCQSGDGLPLPGNSWKGMKSEPINELLPLVPRMCPNIRAKRYLGANFRPKRLVGTLDNGDKMSKRVGFNPRNIAIYKERMRLGDDIRRRSLRSKREYYSPSYDRLRFNPFDLVKRVGQPMNEMKRVGQPMNEMKRGPTGIRMRKAATKNMVRMRKDGEQVDSGQTFDSLMRDPDLLTRDFNKRLWSTRMKKSSHQNRFNDLEKELNQAFSLVQNRGKRVFGKIRLRDFERAEAERHQGHDKKSGRSQSMGFNILDNPYVQWKKRSVRTQQFNQLSNELSDALNMFGNKRSAMSQGSGFTKLDNDLHEAFGLLNLRSPAHKRGSRETRLNELESDLSDALDLLNQLGWRPGQVKKVPFKRANAQRFSKLNQEVDDLMDAFGQAKRNKRSSPMSHRELDELESKLRDAFTILNTIGYQMDDSHLRKRFDKRAPETPEYESPDSVPEDGPDTWSDYDSWGLDFRKKKGLGNFLIDDV